jgi:hypothetical protein
MASPIFSARVVLNARWVKWRLNATRGAQAGEEVEEHRQPDVGPAQPPAPGQRDSGQQGKQGHYHEDLDQQLLTGRALSVEQRADTGPLNGRRGRPGRCCGHGLTASSGDHRGSRPPSGHFRCKASVHRQPANQRRSRRPGQTIHDRASQAVGRSPPTLLTAADASLRGAILTGRPRPTITSPNAHEHEKAPSPRVVSRRHAGVRGIRRSRPAPPSTVGRLRRRCNVEQMKRPGAPTARPAGDRPQMALLLKQVFSVSTYSRPPAPLHQPVAHEPSHAPGQDVRREPEPASRADPRRRATAQEDSARSCWTWRAMGGAHAPPDADGRCRGAHAAVDEDADAAGEVRDAAVSRCRGRSRPADTTSVRRLTFGG